MTDVHDSITRSKNMAAIRSTDTKPELYIRKILYGAGYRYRLHVKKLPGKPDIVLKKYKLVIFVNGCFWHGHNCELFKLPKTRTEFWKNKIHKNKTNDTSNTKKLIDSGWKVKNIWECEIKKEKKINGEQIIEDLSDLINLNV